jgi:hypothetical protein
MGQPVDLRNGVGFLLDRYTGRVVFPQTAMTTSASKTA